MEPVQDEDTTFERLDCLNDAFSAVIKLPRLGLILATVNTVANLLSIDRPKTMKRALAA